MTRTIYHHEGLRAELIDNEAIALFAEGVYYLTVTLDEWRGINQALEALEG